MITKEEFKELKLKIEEVNLRIDNLIKILKRNESFYKTSDLNYI